MEKNGNMRRRIARMTLSKLPSGSTLARMWALRQRRPHTVLKGMKPLWTEGDLLWAKISGYPYWPCMVTKDPITNHFFRRSGVDRDSPSLSYHVQFFGVGGERSWVTRAFQFEGREEFFVKAKEELDKNKYKVSAAWFTRLNYAITQAELAKNMFKKKRLDQYQLKYAWGKTKRSLNNVLCKHFHYFPCTKKKFSNTCSSHQFTNNSMQYNPDPAFVESKEYPVFKNSPDSARKSSRSAIISRANCYYKNSLSLFQTSDHVSKHRKCKKYSHYL